MLRTLLFAAALAVYPAAADAQSVASLFTQLPADFGHLAAPSNLAILGAAGGGSLALLPGDRALALKILDADQIFVPGTVLGNGATNVAAGLALFVGGRLTHNMGAGELGADLLRAQIVSGVITDGLKLAVDRTRPDGRRYSFPSGHTSSAFASAAVIERHYGWKAGVPAYVLATYVGGSRLANFRHFASDVAFGAGIGLAAGRATTFHLHETQITINPLVTRDRTGISIGLTH